MYYVFFASHSMYIPSPNTTTYVELNVKHETLGVMQPRNLKGTMQCTSISRKYVSLELFLEGERYPMTTSAPATR